MFETKKIKRIHYDLIKEWWIEQGFPPMPWSSLPKLGFIVRSLETGEYLYAGFIFLTGTPTALIEFIVGNPKASPAAKRGALDAGIRFVSDLLSNSKSGVKNLLTFTNHSGLINSLKKSNFDVTDKCMTHLVKKI